MRPPRPVVPPPAGAIPPRGGEVFLTVRFRRGSTGWKPLRQWPEHDMVLTGSLLGASLIAPRHPLGWHALGRCVRSTPAGCLRPGSLLFDEPRDRHLQGVGDQQQVRVSRVSFAALVALDAASFEADPVGELVLGQVQIAAALGDAFAQFQSAGDYPFG